VTALGSKVPPKLTAPALDENSVPVSSQLISVTFVDQIAALPVGVASLLVK